MPVSMTIELPLTEEGTPSLSERNVEEVDLTPSPGPPVPSTVPVPSSASRSTDAPSPVVSPPSRSTEGQGKFQFLLIWKIILLKFCIVTGSSSKQPTTDSSKREAITARKRG